MYCQSSESERHRQRRSLSRVGSGCRSARMTGTLGSCITSGSATLAIRFGADLGLGGLEHLWQGRPPMRYRGIQSHSGMSPAIRRGPQMCIHRQVRLRVRMASGHTPPLGMRLGVLCGTIVDVAGSDMNWSWAATFSHVADTTGGEHCEDDEWLAVELLRLASRARPSGARLKEE